MTKSSVEALSEKLQAKLQADRQAVDDLTQKQLVLHESSLREVSASALRTTKSDIKKLHSETVQRLRWLMLWPMLATVLLCLLMLFSSAAYSWWTVSQADAQVQQKQQQIRQAEAAFCATPAGLKVCRTQPRSQ